MTQCVLQQRATISDVLEGDLEVVFSMLIIITTVLFEGYHLVAPFTNR